MRMSKRSVKMKEYKWSTHRKCLMVSSTFLTPTKIALTKNSTAPRLTTAPTRPDGNVSSNVTLKKLIKLEKSLTKKTSITSMKTISKLSTASWKVEPTAKIDKTNNSALKNRIWTKQITISITKWVEKFKHPWSILLVKLNPCKTPLLKIRTIEQQLIKC